MPELRTAAAAPERAVGPRGFCTSSIASDLNCRWTFSSEDVARSSVVGHERRDSVSDVVENEPQSSPRFGRRIACSPDRLGLPAKWVSLRSRSNVILGGGWEGCRSGWRCIWHCGRFVAVVLVFLRQESGTRAGVCEPSGLTYWT